MVEHRAKLHHYIGRRDVDQRPDHCHDKRCPGIRVIQAGLQAASRQQDGHRAHAQQPNAAVDYGSVGAVPGRNHKHRQPRFKPGAIGGGSDSGSAIAGSIRSQAIPRTEITTNDPNAKDKMTIGAESVMP